MATSVKRQTERMASTAAALLMSLLFLLPILWLVVSAFRPAAVSFDAAYPLHWSILWPEQGTLDNFRSAWVNGFGRNLLNSLLVAAVTVVLGLAVSALAAFALAAINFRGQRLLFSVVVISFLVPFEAIAIPLSRSFADWGLTNSLMALILPGLGNGLAVFTLRQSFLGIPTSLGEAARIDGAGWFRILVSIYLPLSRPALVGAGLILFLFQWQAYLWPILVISQSDLDVAPVAIAKTFGAFSTDYGRVFAETAVLAVVPAVVLFSLQRYFVSSLASTGSKG